MKEGTVSTQAVATVIDAIEGMGIDRDAFLRSVGIKPEALEVQDGRLPLVSALMIFREAERLTGDPTIALRIVERLRPTAPGINLYLFRASPTLRSAFERLVRYIPLTSDCLEMEFEVRGPQAFVRWRMNSRAVPMQPQQSEFYGGLLLRTGRECTMAPWKPLEVHFSHPPIEPRAERERILGAPVVFSRPHDQIVLPASVLDLPLRERDPVLLEMMQRHANALLRKVTPRTLRERVRSMLVDLIPEGRATLEEVAAALSASPRTLQRELRQEGTSFTGELDAVKREVAEQYITSSRMEIIEVAFITGFTELSAFYRAFRRWTGTTPGEYRRQHVAG
jgi:AraC-like DNA-binding protein